MTVLKEAPERQNCRQNVASKIHQLVEQCRQGGNKSLLCQMQWETVLFRARREAPEKPGCRCFSPFRELPAESRAYFERRAAGAANPILRARYAHYLWDAYREEAHAMLAIRAHLDCALLCADRRWWPEAHEALLRAVKLCQSLRREHPEVESCLIRVVRDMLTQNEIRRARLLIETVLALAGDVPAAEELRQLSELARQAGAMEGGE
ncbi:DUF7380 domain-containing protein [Desulfotomaculum copahuensis]|uniref:DUF7380 domain-containing protein n=1 Tax=Desulfotomaculum copahuensis TaxID=1838280 RepID=A0A1B7LIY3_9FIRM|nr:hypothetical protein [Desulfotomaculum copahuensis]OAT86524.1 hypothetical protein A6M21_03695 [Desulfotomaculum copahuensis]